MSPLEILNEMRVPSPFPIARIDGVYCNCAIYSYAINPKPAIENTSEHLAYLEKQLIHLHAQYLYCRHMELNHVAHSYMWGQCTEDYRNAWILIAEAEAEAPALEEGN